MNSRIENLKRIIITKELKSTIKNQPKQKSHQAHKVLINCPRIGNSKLTPTVPETRKNGTIS